MSTFPLQTGLIDAVIDFANAPLVSPDEIRTIFKGTWRPNPFPALRTARSNQRELREWLSNIVAGTGEVEGFAWAMMGLQSVPADKDSGIPFEGWFGFRMERDGKKVRYSVTWNWWITKAPLLAICGLGVASIYQAELQHRVGQCNWHDCDRFFIDRESRGKPQRFCCADHGNADRQRRYRMREKSRRLSRKRIST